MWTKILQQNNIVFSNGATSNVNAVRVVFSRQGLGHDWGLLLGTVIVSETSKTQMERICPRSIRGETVKNNITIKYRPRIISYSIIVQTDEFADHILLLLS